MGRLIACITVLIMITAGLSVHAETITIVADPWPPFNGVPQSNAEGYMVDIARTIFNDKGISVKYTTIPWKRAVQDTRKGIYNGVIGASKTDAKGFIFPKEELARNMLAFYVKRENTWRFHDLDSIKQIRLGTIGGYDYRKWLNDYIQSAPKKSDKVQIILGDVPLQRNLNKLMLERIDVVVDTEAAIRWEAKRLNILHKIQPAGYGKEPSYCYIAFSPNLVKSIVYAKILSNGIIKLRAEGKLQKILDKYGIIDWKTI